MENDLLAKRRAPATHVWRLWDGAILPCNCKLLLEGEPRLVGLYFRTKSVTRCIVRLEWKDGTHWVRESLDAPWHVHASGEESSEAWADFVCERVRIEWCCDALRAELRARRAA